MTSRHALIATALQSFSVVVERSQLQFFASAIGEEGTAYVDVRLDDGRVTLSGTARVRVG